MTPYYILACLFGFGSAAIAAYGIWGNTEFPKGKSVLPFLGFAVVLAAATLGAAIGGALNEGHGGDHEETTTAAQVAH